jgi:hypothetical protein
MTEHYRRGRHAHGILQKDSILIALAVLAAEIAAEEGRAADYFFGKCRSTSWTGPQSGRLIVGQQAFQRSYIALPTLVPEPLSILRAGFDAIMQDAQYLAEAEGDHRAGAHGPPSWFETARALCEEHCTKRRDARASSP